MGWQRGMHDHHCGSHLLNILVHAWLLTAPSVPMSGRSGGGGGGGGGAGGA